jgi:hypothetical protein
MLESSRELLGFQEVSLFKVDNESLRRAVASYELSADQIWVNYNSRFGIVVNQSLVLLWS